MVAITSCGCCVYSVLRGVALYQSSHLAHRRLFAAQGASSLLSGSTAQHVNPVNLRLTLLNRDFDENDYETLLALDDSETPTNMFKGATQAQINHLPSYVVQQHHGMTEAPLNPPSTISGEESSTKSRSCAICLEAFESGDTLRIMPCFHQFHLPCLDYWLLQNATCPVCKLAI